VNENIRAAFALNEPVTLGIIEPLDGSGLTICHYQLLQTRYFFMSRRRFDGSVKTFFSAFATPAIELGAGPAIRVLATAEGRV
jgi:hypothetical protein